MSESCWNTIGVRGDLSCQELEQYVHCGNCPVHAAAAVALLDNAPPADYVARWTEDIAAPRHLEERHTDAVVIFRVGSEWLALTTSAVSEVLSPLPIHSLPHRRHDAVLGVANVRGELVVCVSLGRILGLEPPAEGVRPVERRRLLLICADHTRVACPVDEVQGVVRFHQRELKDLPATLAKAAGRHSRKVLLSEKRSVGVLDNGLLLSSLKRSFA